MEALVNKLNGKVLTSCVISEISYHSMLIEIEVEDARQIINNPNTDLIKCDQVMFFRPVGQLHIFV